MANDPLDVFGLAEWFLSADLDIPDGFQLDPSRRIINAKKFMETLRRDAQDVIDGHSPRNRYGAVEKDLRLLRAYAEGKG